MIFYFPTFYPDESLYSCLARYSSHNLIQKFKVANQNLFFSPSYPSSSTIDLPRAVGALAQEISIASGIEKKTIIDDHTLWPFYKTFIVPEKAEFIEEKLFSLNTISSSLHLYTGLNSSTFTRQSLPKYCSLCIEQDTHEFGEPYWHRTHSIPNIQICPKHLIALSTPDNPSPFRRRNIYTPLAAITKTKSKPQQITNEYWIKFAYLLTSFLYKETNNRLRNYKKEFLAIGFGLLNGKLDYEKIELNLLPYLNILEPGSYLKGNKYWLKDICNRTHRVFDPTRHTLIQLFLKDHRNQPTPTFSEDPYLKFFGTGPFKCFNKAADHFGQNTITTSEFYTDKKSKRLIGKFTCSCGMVYSKSFLPEAGTDSAFQRTLIFGEVWIAKLKTLIKETLSLRETARQLGVDPRTIVQQAHILNLSHPWSPNLGQGNHGKGTGQIQAEIAAKRKLWKKFLFKGGEGVKAARNNQKSLYAWLYRNDRNWLIDYNRSFKSKSHSNEPRRAWAERDTRIVQLLQDNLKKINPLLRQRISIAYLVLTLPNDYAYVAKNLKKLPLTKSFLSENSESVSQYQLRRISFIAAEFKEAAIPLSRWRIYRAAGLRHPLSPDVKDILESIFR